MFYLASIVLMAAACFFLWKIKRSKRATSARVEEDDIIELKPLKENQINDFLDSDREAEEVAPNLIPSEKDESPNRFIEEIEPDEVAFIDLETTGLDPSNDRIIEVALFILPLGVSCRVEGYSKLANPGIPIPKRITEITGITDSMIEGEKPVGEVVAEFLDAIGNRPIAAYNANFDASFLKEEAKRINRTFDNESVCMMQYVKNKHPDLKRYRLGDVCDAFGITENESEKTGASEHRALYDAERVLRLFLAVSAGRQPTPPGPRAEDRKLDYDNLEKYNSLRLRAKGFSTLAKDKERINLDEAISIHLKAVRLLIQAGQIEIYTTTTEWSGPSMTGDIGEISCLDRLTLCLCKKGRVAEASEAVEEYFSVFPKQSELKSAAAIRARVAKAAQRAAAPSASQRTS